MIARGTDPWCINTLPPPVNDCSANFTDPDAAAMYADNLTDV